MTEAEMKSQILGQLGEPTIKVEIDPGQWCGIFAKTIRWFKAKKGLIGCEVVQLIPGQQQYDFPDNCNTVTDIFLPMGFGDVQALFSQGILDTNLIPADFYGINGGSYSRYGFTVSNSAYVQVLQYLETTRKVISAEPAWEILCDKIIVSNGWCGTYSGGGQFMLVTFQKQNFTVDDIKNHRDVDLIYRYTEATAKQLLGRIRSKFKSYPAAGGMIDTDGPELLEEARAEFEKLEEEISESQYPMGFLVG